MQALTLGIVKWNLVYQDHLSKFCVLRAITSKTVEVAYQLRGKPRYPQSQGSVERLNADIKDILLVCLGENQSVDWPVRLKFVQFRKNCSFHSGIKQSPYKALFGVNPRIGLRSTALPSEVLERMISKDDL